MKRTVIAVAVAGIAGVAAAAFVGERTRRNLAIDALPLGATGAERRILSVLEQAHDSGRVYLQVPVSSGRILRLLTESVNAKTVVEVGTSTGYSGLWLCLALENTGGKLITFEIDTTRASAARAHFEQAGVAERVTLIEGDAHEGIRAVKGPVDVVFLDADKQGYLDYLHRLLPLVRAGGLIIADNFEMAPDYEKAVTTNPELETVLLGQMAVTLKKRGPELIQARGPALSGLQDCGNTSRAVGIPTREY